MFQPPNAPTAQGIRRCAAIALVCMSAVISPAAADERYETKFPDAMFGDPDSATSANAGLSLPAEEPAIPDAAPRDPEYPIAPELPIAEEVEQPGPVQPAHDRHDSNDAEQQIVGPKKDRPADTPPTAAALSVEDATITRGSRGASASTSDRPWYASGVVPMALVLGVIGVITLLVRKLSVGSKLTGGEVLNVLCRTHVSPKQSIALVQMGGRMVFVGVSPQQISTLRVVDDREEVLTLRAKLRISTKTEADKPFGELLSGEENRFESALEPMEDSSAENADQVRRTRDDLNNLLDRLRTRKTRGKTSSANSRHAAEPKT